MMRVLIEQYSYKVTDLPLELRKLERESDGKVSFDRVGYYLDDKVHDCVFILPKVVLWTRDDKGNELVDANGRPTEKVLGDFTPEEFVDLEALEKNHPSKVARIREIRRFIYEFSTWIYRALKVYNKAYPGNDIVLERHTQHTGHTGRRRKSETLLDVLLSIQDFAKENRDFFFFVVKNRHSGLNKINWTRTIAKSTAVVQDGCVAYLSPVNKKRQVNFDEELLVIFFSILNYMAEKYGFSVKIDLGYELITGNRFQSYVEKGLGKRRLLKIKYKYFSDKALKLWDLCYAFFESEHQIFLAGDHEEYLLVKKFDRVFEAMIDELVGDRKDEMPKALTKQDDGKMVDHMYLYQDLIENKDKSVDTFYIGDSKYYKYGTQLGKEAIYKQFTYAKNVIQWRLNLFLDDKDESDEVKADKATFVGGKKVGNVRDEVTEGYDITPNFFISAMMTEDLKGGFRDGKVVPTTHGKGKQSYILKQFENRLFDRDTLIVAHYDVNFLFVLSLYAQDKAYRKAAWREDVRRQFRGEIQELLSKQYKFWAMTPRVQGTEREFLKSDFQKILGKVYKPFEDDKKGRPCYSLALERGMPQKDMDEIKGWLERSFVVKDCQLGEDPWGKFTEEELSKAAKGAGPTVGVLSSLGTASATVNIENEEVVAVFQDTGWYISESAPEGESSAYGAETDWVFLFDSAEGKVAYLLNAKVYKWKQSAGSVQSLIPHDAKGVDAAKLITLMQHTPPGVFFDVWEVQSWMKMG